MNKLITIERYGIKLVIKLRHLFSLLLVGLVIASMGIVLLPRSAIPKSFAQQIPTTPTVPVCGVRKLSDETAYTGPALPNPAFSNIISPSGGNGGISNYQYWPGTSTLDPRWYVEQNGSGNSPIFYVYDATTNSLINSFTINIPTAYQGQLTVSPFALDSAGNIYIGTYADSSAGGAVMQWLWSPGDTSATLGWASYTSNLVEGGLYSYVDSNGIERIAAPLQTDSETFNASTGSVMGTNNIVGNSVINALSYNNDLVVMANNGTIEIWNSTATTETFYMSAGAAGSSWFNPSGANILPNGNIVVTSYQNRSVAFFSSSGGLLGTIGADYGAGDPLPYVDPSTEVVVANSNIYYLANNPYSAPNTIVSLSITTANDYLAAPQNVPFQLGLGAGIQTSASSNNYFPSGTTPSVSVYFNQWWQNNASQFSGTYTIRDMSQILSNQSGTAVPFSIPANSSDYVNNTATVPLTLPTPNPGMYEVNVTLSQGSTVVGAACTDYSIGAANDSFFNPSTLPSGQDTSGITLAHDFGQKLYRSSYNIDACFPGVTNPTSTTTINCSTAMINDISSAAALAKQDGIAYDFQLGTGTTFDQNAIASGQWQRLVGLVVAQFPEITDWECWNEPDNNSFSSPAAYVTNALEPCYNAIKAVSTSNQVIGISNENYSVSNYSQYVAAGALNYLNIVAFHGYTGWNKSEVEQGNIIPSIYNNTGETGQIQALQTYLASKGYSGPLYDTESGYWNNTSASPYNYYNQGDLLVTKMILYQSDGISRYSNFFNVGGYQVNGTYWSLIGGSQNILNPGGLAAINYEANLGGRQFLNWLPTGVPHTFAALYGPSATNNNDVVATWADSYNVNVVPTLSGGGSMSVTSEYGDTSTLNNGSMLTLANQVQYISVPNGQTLNIQAAESYGTNYALVSQGASATASSSYVCSNGTTVNPNVVLYGIDDAGGNNYICSGRDNSNVWSATYADNNPTLTITLKNPVTIDRVFISSTSIGSSLTGLRNYVVKVNSGNGVFNPVATVSNLYFNRNNLVSFPAQTVSQIEITNMQINYSGYGNGLPPGFWPSMGTNNDLTSIYDVEAYGPGTGIGTPPTISTNSLANNQSIYSQWPISTTITPSSTNTITQAQLLIGGQLVQTDTAYPYNFVLDTTKFNDGTYNVEIIAKDNQGNTTTADYNLNIINGDFNGLNSVGLSDLIILAQNYGKPGDYAQGNITGGSDIGLPDLIILAKNYGYKLP